MPPTVYWQDSGLFLTGIKTFGIVFPPGFPLYLLLGVIWVKATFFIQNLLGLNFTQTVYAFSGLWGVLAASLVALTVDELFQKEKLNPNLETAISIMTGISTGLSYSLWSQAINAEVYSFAGFFAALLFLMITKIIKTASLVNSEEPDIPLLKSKLFRFILFLGIVWGFSLANHPLTIVFLPAIFWLFYTLHLLPFSLIWLKDRIKPEVLISWKKWFLIFLFFLVCAGLPYLYLPIRSQASPDLLWSKIDSPERFFDHISSKVYRTAEGAIEATNWPKILSYPLLFFQEFFLFGLLSGLSAVILTLRKNHRFYFPYLIFGLIFTATLYLLITFYDRGTEYNSWLIVFYLYFYTLVGLGFGQILSLGKFPKILLLLIISLGLIGPQILVNLPILNRAHYTLAQEYGQNLIGKLPPKAIFFTVGDQESAIPIYLQSIQGYRKDVAVMWDSVLTTRWQYEDYQRKHPDLVYPSLDFDPNHLQENINLFISANLPDYRLFLITRNIVNLDQRFQLIPSGTIWEVTKTSQEKIIDLSFWQFSFSDANRYQRPERPELYRKKTIYVKNQPVVQRERVPYFDEVRVFELQAQKNLGDLCFSQFQNKETLKLKTVNGEIQEWSNRQLLTCAVTSYEKMLSINPQFFHLEVFTNLAKLYQENSDQEKAQIILSRIAEQQKLSPTP